MEVTLNTGSESTAEGVVELVEDIRSHQVGRSEESNSDRTDDIAEQQETARPMAAVVVN